MTEKTKRSEQQHNRIYKIKDVVASTVETAKEHKIETAVVLAIAVLFLANNLHHFDTMRSEAAYVADRIGEITRAVLTGDSTKLDFYKKSLKLGVAWLQIEVEGVNGYFLEHARAAAFLVTLIYLVKQTLLFQKDTHSAQSEKTQNVTVVGKSTEVESDDEYESHLAAIREKLSDFNDEATTPELTTDLEKAVQELTQ